ncbi:WhiB family transcriptional regulator (plasmid) [Streptosporangium sandarakinum]|uniref:WhiB family transcriptional regulator n=1 Tax=Streptosporangium sandarakinum TaxID=1260955 RepID=UPI003D8EBF69
MSAFFQIEELFGRAAELTWMDRAACVGSDGDAWFPEEGGRPSPQVRRICDGCPVREDCLAYGSDWPGVWGGKTERARRKHDA